MTRVSIAQLRMLIRTKAYVVSHHAADELDDDNLSILDLESIVLTGEIAEVQRDPITGETKQVIRGRCLQGIEGEAVVKLGFTGTLIIITVYVV